MDINIVLTESEKNNLMVFLDRVQVKGVQETMTFANLTSKVGNSIVENPEVKEYNVILTDSEINNLMVFFDRITVKGINETMTFANLIHKIGSSAEK